MRIKKLLIVLSVFLNIGLITFLVLKEDHLTNAYSNLSFGLQGDLVQLEGAIDYQIQNNWSEGDTVIEKIEDIRESIQDLMVTGKDFGVISRKQEEDLWDLHRFFSKFPTYSGYPNTNLDHKSIEDLVQLKDDLRAAGWGMNLGYSSDWVSFSEKINDLTR